MYGSAGRTSVLTPKAWKVSSRGWSVFCDTPGIGALTNSPHWKGPFQGGLAAVHHTGGVA